MSIWDIGRVSFSLLQVSDNVMFNYFFTLIAYFGLLSFAISILVKILSRS